MNFWKIAWRSIQQRALASSLTSFSMALGVMLVVCVLVVYNLVSVSFRNNASLGYNMIVAAKGGPLQVVLNTVFYLSSPVENIPYDYYLEFKDAETRAAAFGEDNSDGQRDGKFAAFSKIAIPVCLGDYFHRFRVVGTTPELFDDLRFGPEADRQYAFAEGRNFVTKSAEHGYFEAVVGSIVAAEVGVRVGDEIAPSHGAPDGHGHEQKFTIVGVLAPSGTPNDRGVFINMEGFYLMADHAKPVKKDASNGESESAPAAAKGHDEHADHDHAHDHDHHHHGELKPLPIEEREVTAILLRTISPLVTPGLKNMINEGNQAQGVLPVQEIYTLFDLFIKPVQTVLLVLTAMICVTSGISILVSIYNSMNDRRQDIAIMRALGAGRSTVMAIVLAEAAILALGGGGLGWLAGHGIIALAGPTIEQQTGVLLRFFDFTSAELLLIPALMLLAVVVGLLPAFSAYRTDVARSL